MTVAIAACVLLWPTLLNRHPYLFWDSYGYFGQGLAYWRLLLAGVGFWPLPAAVAEAGWIGSAATLLPSDPAIRAIPYSLLFWPIVAGGGFWALAAANAIVAAYSLDVALERLIGLGLAGRVGVLAMLAATSGLPWFASYAMPDLWAGLMILAAVTVAMGWERLDVGQRVAMLVVIGAGAAFHASHLLLAIALAAVAAVLIRRPRPALRIAVPAAVSAVAAAGLGWLLFGIASPTPNSPPFLLARQIEDGPARAYLRDSCPDAGWALCPRLDRLWPNAQDFLWSENDSYWGMPELRVALREEELAIVAAAAARYPVMQVRASGANVAIQATRFGLDDHVTGRGARVRWDDYDFTFDASVPARRWGLGGFTAVIYATAGVSVIIVLWHAWPSRGGRGLGAAGWLILIGVGLNAVICGALSGPHARYQGRVMWLVPLLAATLVLRRPYLSRPDQAGSERLSA